MLFFNFFILASEAGPSSDIIDHVREAALGKCNNRDFSGYYKLAERYYDERDPDQSLSTEDLIEYTQDFKTILTFLYECWRFNFDDPEVETHLTISWNTTKPLLERHKDLKLRVFDLWDKDLTLEQWFRQQLLNLCLPYAYTPSSSALFNHCKLNGPSSLAQTFLSPFMPVSIQVDILKTLFAEPEHKEEIMTMIHLLLPKQFLSDSKLFDFALGVKNHFNIAFDPLALAIESKGYAVLNTLEDRLIKYYGPKKLRNSVCDPKDFKDLLTIYKEAYVRACTQYTPPDLREKLREKIFEQAHDAEVLVKLYFEMKKYGKFNGHVILAHIRVENIQNAEVLKSLEKYLQGFEFGSLERSKYQEVIAALKVVASSYPGFGCLVA